MRPSVRYGLLIAVPPAFTAWSGTFLIADAPVLGAGIGLVFGALLFGLVVLGREYGSEDGRSTGEL